MSCIVKMACSILCLTRRVANMRGDIHAGQQKPATPDACKVFVNEKELDLIKQKTALFGTENMSAYLRKMAIGGSIINLDMPERDAENGSWVAGTPAACFSQESKDAVERLLYDRDTNSSDGGGFLSVLGIRPFGHPALHRSRLRPVPGTARRLQPKSAVLLRHPHELDFRLRRRRRLTGATAALPDAKGPEGGAFPGNRRNYPKGKGAVRAPFSI